MLAVKKEVAVVAIAIKKIIVKIKLMEILVRRTGLKVGDPEGMVIVVIIEEIGVVEEVIGVVVVLEEVEDLMEMVVATEEIALEEVIGVAEEAEAVVLVEEVEVIGKEELDKLVIAG